MGQFSRFLVVGLFNTALGYAIIFACMYLLKMTPETSNIAGYGIGLITSYLLNKYYTFSSKHKSTSEMIRFIAVFAIAYGANFGMLYYLVHNSSIPKGLSQVLAGIIYVAATFVMNKYYVFKSKTATV